MWAVLCKTKALQKYKVELLLEVNAINVMPAVTFYYII